MHRPARGETGCRGARSPPRGSPAETPLLPGPGADPGADPALPARPPAPRTPLAQLEPFWRRVKGAYGKVKARPART